MVNRDSYERHAYLVDGFRVGFEGVSAWHCVCHEFSLVGSCRHTREAAGMRDAQALIRQHLRAGGSGLRGPARQARGGQPLIRDFPRRPTR